jgi:hypothetical protein
VVPSIKYFPLAMSEAFLRTSLCPASRMESMNPKTEPVTVPMHPPNTALLNNSPHRKG